VAIAIVVAAAASVQTFSGFGFALLGVPLLSFVIDPKVAAPDQVVAYGVPGFHEGAIESIKQTPLDVGIRMFAKSAMDGAMLRLAYGVAIARGDAIVNLEHGIVQVRSDDGDLTLHPPKRVDAIAS